MYKTSISNQTKNGLFDLPKIEEQDLSFFERSQGWQEIEFFLDEQVKEPKYYRNIIHRIMNTSEDDIIRLYINTEGGNLVGALALVDALHATDATVVAIITGEAASAGSLIALSCDNIMVSPNARMMIHPPSYGLVDSSPVINSRVKHNQEWFERMFKEAYSDFLTEKEIEEVLNGKELWFFAEEINNRLENRIEIRRKKYEEQQALELKEQEEKAAEVEVATKPRSKKKAN